jgi:integrase
MNNPCLERITFHRPAPPSVSEIRALLADTAATTTERNLHDVILIIATTGLRPGELAWTKWADIDFGRRRLRIRTKSSAGNRLVPFCPGVLERLIERRKQFPGAEYVLGAQPQNSLRLVSRQLRKTFEATCGLRINLHWIRHFFFTQWLNFGGDYSSLARVAGWSLSRVFPSVKVIGKYESDLGAVIQEQIEKSITS